MEKLRFLLLLFGLLYSGGGEESDLNKVEVDGTSCNDKISKYISDLY